jgi:hypothetical protein
LLSIEGLGRLCPAGPIQFFAPSTKSNKGAVLQRLFLSTEGVPADDSRADRRTLLWRPRNIRTKKNWPSLFLPVLGRLMKANAGKRSTQLYRRRTRGPSGPTTSELISIGPFFVPSEKSPRRSTRRSTPSRTGSTPSHTSCSKPGSSTLLEAWRGSLIWTLRQYQASASSDSLEACAMRRSTDEPTG